MDLVAPAAPFTQVEQPATAATADLAVPGIPGPTPRQALPHKAARPAVTVEMADQAAAPLAALATAAMAATVVLAEQVATVEMASRLAINPTEQTLVRRVLVEPVESVELSAHSRARYLAPAATEATQALLEMVVLPPAAETVATLVTEPLVELAVLAVLATELAPTADMVEMAEMPATVEWLPMPEPQSSEVTVEMAATVEMAVLAVPLVALAPAEVDPQEQQELRGSPETVVTAVSAAQPRMPYQATVELAERLSPATVATVEPVDQSPGLHQAMQSVVKVALEVRSLPVRVPEVLVALVEQPQKQQSTVMQPVAPVESVVL